MSCTEEVQVDAGKRVVEVHFDFLLGHPNHDAVEFLSGLVAHHDDLALVHHGVVHALLVHELGLGQDGKRALHFWAIRPVGRNEQLHGVAHLGGLHGFLEVFRGSHRTRPQR